VIARESAWKRPERLTEPLTVAAFNPSFDS